MSNLPVDNLDTNVEAIKSRLLSVMSKSSIDWVTGVKFFGAFVKSDSEGKCALCVDGSRIAQVGHGVPPTAGYDHIYHIHEVVDENSTSVNTTTGDITVCHGTASKEIAEFITGAPQDIMYLLLYIEKHLENARPQSE